MIWFKIGRRREKENYPSFSIPLFHFIRFIEREKKTDILFLLDEFFNSKTKEPYYKENTAAVFLNIFVGAALCSVLLNIRNYSLISIYFTF